MPRAQPEHFPQVWEVIVSNIGCVYRGNDGQLAADIWSDYRDLSTNGIGRAAGESVTLVEDGFIICADFIGANDED